MPINGAPLNTVPLAAAEATGSGTALGVALSFSMALPLAYAPPVVAVPVDRRTVLAFDESNRFSPSLPPSRWVPRERAIGGRLVAASGLTSSYAVRRDRCVELTLRLLESEWLEFSAYLQSMQMGTPFDWYPTADSDVSYRVVLMTPMPGERWAPSRLAGFARVFEATITLRGVGDVMPWRPFYQD